MHRHELTEQEWKILQTAIPPRMGRPPRIATRKFLNAVFWKIKTGVPWRDLPKRYGKWKTIYNRFNRSAKANYFETIFKTLQIEVDNEWNMIGVLQHAMRRPPQAIWLLFISLVSGSGYFEDTP